MSRPPVLVVGVGNPWRSDDAVGLEIVRRLRPDLPPAVETLEHDGEPASLLDLWGEAHVVLVVDAVSSGSAPGTVHRLDAGAAPLPASLFHSSTHALGLPEAVELGRALDRLPARLIVFGVEGERFDAGARLSPAVEAVVPAVTAEILAEVGHTLARS